MKRSIILFMVACMIVPVLSCADVLSSEWEKEGLEELALARDQLSQQIDELQADARELFEPIRLKGNDQSLIRDVMIPQAPARITITGDVEVTFSRFKYEKKIVTSNHFEKRPYTAAFTESGTFDIDVASRLSRGIPDWTLTIEPLLEGGFVKQVGNSTDLTGIFTLPQSPRIRFKGKNNESSAFSDVSLDINFYNQAIDAWDRITIFQKSLREQEEYEIDLQISLKEGELEEGVKCFFSINTKPQVEWGLYPLK